MDDGMARRLGFLVCGCVGLLGVVGLALAVVGLSIPPFTDVGAAESMLNGGDIPDDKEQWWATLESLRTARWQYLDPGLGLLIVAACLALALVRVDARDVRNLARWRGPRSAWMFMLLSVACWCLPLAVSVHGMEVDYDRGNLVWWADSGAALNVAIHFVMTQWGLPVVLVLAWLLCVWRCPRGVSLFHWDPDRPGHGIFWTVVFLPPIAFAGFFLIVFVLQGPWSGVLVELLTLYVLLAGRAAASARQLRPAIATLPGKSPG